jgi:predicted SnoaL-like aldol condensation-catalyzing enzyme
MCLTADRHARSVSGFGATHAARIGEAGRNAFGEVESLAMRRGRQMSDSQVDVLDEPSQTPQSKNKQLVLKAFDTLFNERDFDAAEKFWSTSYIQHSAHIPPGRDGLFDLVRNAPVTMKYENRLILAEGNILMLHGRFSGLAQPANWIVVDIVRVEGGRLAEHWDVIEDEATRESSVSGLPMFGNSFPD